VPDLTSAFALTAAVLILTALASGIVDRAPISHPIIFLALGVLLGPRGLGVIDLTADSPMLEVIAILTLALVLFIDALKIRFDEVGDEWVIPILSLGPGTILTIGVYTVAAYALFGTTLAESLLLGAILSSTDPVVLRDVLRDERIPRSVRRALGVEASTNDLVVLPTVLILIALLQSTAQSLGSWLAFLGQLFVLGPLAGIGVGWAGAWLMDKVDARFGISRLHQVLYGLGLVLAAYVAGELIGGSGFVAAFAAGAAVSLSNVELCDCFVEYGETTAEIAMLLAFTLFGTLLSTMVTQIELVPALLFALLGIVVARPLAMTLVLRRAVASRQARLFISWFGPRGLNSLLLALLVVQSGVSGAEHLLAIAGVVVFASAILHGSSATPLGAWYGRVVAEAAQTLQEERESTAAGLFRESAGEVSRLSASELAELLAGPSPPVVLDVRARSHYAEDHVRIPGSIRVPPDQVVEWAIGRSRDRPVVTYCT